MILEAQAMPGANVKELAGVTVAPCPEKLKAPRLLGAMGQLPGGDLSQGVEGVHGRRIEHSIFTPF
jgi:hypothetical protein